MSQDKPCGNCQDCTCQESEPKRQELVDLRAENTILRELLIEQPRLKCVSCGFFTSGSGQWACPSCGKWHYWTGGFTWPVETEHAKRWLEDANGRLQMMVDRKLQQKRQNSPQEGEKNNA